MYNWPSSTNIQNQARLDISARGIWSSHEKVFFDVRVTHPYAPSNINKPIHTLFEEHEKQKMAAYNDDRILQVEKSAFVPLVYTTNGGMSRQCEKLHKQLATLLSKKKGEAYSVIMAHMRTRLRFSILKSTLVAIRGFRGGRGDNGSVLPLSEVDFGTAQLFP